MSVRVTFTSGGLQLDGVLAEPEGTRESGFPAVIICHGFPTPYLKADVIGLAFESLAERIAHELNWVALSFTYRGCGLSEGDFSIAGWLQDIQAAVDLLMARGDITGVWLMGFGTGGALSICAAAADDRVQGVASVAGPADFSDWAEDPKQLLHHARTIGAVRSRDFPPDFEAWSAEFRGINAADRVGEMSHRPLMVMHGNDDISVPVFDSRIVADAHGSAELRVLQGVGHSMRHDPRAIAVLLGWLQRQR